MGIHIPKMEKPKVCVDCPLRQSRKYHEVGYFDYEYCPPLDRVFNERKLDINIFEERFDDCPIEEVDDVAFELAKEPKIGKWIEDDEQIHVEKTYHCSECGYDIWGVDEKSNYCPNCGAEMERNKE